MPELLADAQVAERSARAALEAASDRLDAGCGRPEEVAEAYETWLAAANALKRARREAEVGGVR